MSLYVEERGTGETLLLFVHGWISSRRMWYDVVDALDLQRFRCVLFDFRGAGLSDRPALGHDLDGYASDLRAVLHSLAGPAIVVAHSMGGKVSQFVALDPPAAMHKLVLIAPGTARAFGAPTPRHRQLTEAAYGSRDRIARYQRAAMTAPVSPEALERIVEDALVVQREAWFGWYEHGRKAEFSARLGEIALPTVVAAGQRDPLVPPARLRRDVVSQIAGALFVEIRGAGHNLPIEAPREIAGVIAQFA